MTAARTKVKPPLDTSVSFSEIARNSFVNKVSWTPLASAYPVGYYVLYRNDLEIATSISATTYRDTDIAEDNSYIYTVATVNTNLIEGGPSIEAPMLVPAYPQWQDFALVMNQSATEDVSFHITDPQDRSISFSRQGGDAPAAVTVSPAGVVSSGAAAGGVSTLVIRADNGYLHTDFSASLTVVATAGPSIPINPTAQGTSLTNVRVAWQAGVGGTPATEYRIYRAALENGTFTLRTTVAAPTLLIDDAVPSGETRWYKIAAFANGVESLQTSPPIPGTGVDVPVGGTLIFSDGFESGTLLSQNLATGGWAPVLNGGTATVLTAGGGAPGSTGFYVRSQLIAASNNYRAEIHPRKSNQWFADWPEFEYDTPFYFGVSIRLPTGFVADNLAQESLLQWHNGNVGASIPGDRESTHAGHYSLLVQNADWKWGCINGEGGNTLQGSDVTIGPWAADVNTWARWVFRIVFSSGSASTGSIKVWKNAASEASTPVVNQSNIRTYNSLGDPMKLTMGIYKSSWRAANFANNYDANEVPNVSPRAIHFDKYQVATTFDLVK